MKIKIIAFILMALISVGCSSIFTAYSSSEITLNITQTSGDQLKIVTQKAETSPSGQRSIYDNKSQQIAGYIKIKNKINAENNELVKLDSSNLKSENGKKTISFELLIQNNFLEENRDIHDSIIVWVGENSKTLFKGCEFEIEENSQENSSFFEFSVPINNNKKVYDISLQTLNVIQ